jgi:hypothetical protein
MSDARVDGESHGRWLNRQKRFKSPKIAIHQGSYKAPAGTDRSSQFQLLRTVVAVEKLPFRLKQPKFGGWKMSTQTEKVGCRAS